MRTDLDGPLDWIQVFVKSTAELAAVAPKLKAAIAPDGLVWISYPKGSSKMQTDLTRDKGWGPLEGADLMWLSLVSVDDTGQPSACGRIGRARPVRHFDD
jgi:hypothetical protein